MNILLLTDDQHRFDCYEDGLIPGLRAPHLARLRREGTTLPHAVSNCPICMPTRFTWLHGLYASQVGNKLLHNAYDWPLHFPTMTQALQQKGYHTALIGKLHSLQGLFHRDVCDYEEETRARGFDDVVEVCGKSLAYWYDCRWTRHLDSKGLLKRYRQDCEQRVDMVGGNEPHTPSFLAPEDSMDGFIGRQAERWIREYDGSRPFFLHVSLCGPHFPVDPPEPYFSRHRPEDMPPPEGVDDPQRVRFFQELRARYAGMVEQIDDEAGRVLGALDARGWLDETLVVFTTDHGDMLGHRDRWHKGPPYDTSVRTPVILWRPGTVPESVVRDGPVEAVDLPCTLLAAAGCEEEPAHWLPHTPGRSYWDYVCGRGDAPRDWAYSECGIDGPWRLCRERDWKYVIRPTGEELYCLRDDPWEWTNRADDPAAREHKQRLQTQLLRSMMTAPAPGWDWRAGGASAGSA